MNENNIAAVVVDSAVQVHRTLGPGLLETVYETALAFELDRRGLSVRRQVAIPVVYEGVKLEDGFRADMIVGERVIVEVKSLEAVPPVAYKILLTYLRLSDRRLGLMLNFGEETMRDGIKRIVNRLQE
jgi:GxxExxY protein